MATTSPVTRVNKQLAQQGRMERVVRTRGYYMLNGGDAIKLQEAGLYSLGGEMLPPTNDAYANLAQCVQLKLEQLGVAVKFDGVTN